MVRKRQTLPAMLHHSPSDRARVRINGEDIYLGPWGSEEAAENYRRLCAELLAAPAPPPNPKRLLDGKTVQDVILGYREHRADESPNGMHNDERLALKALRKLYGRSAAAEFGPLKLRAYRKQLIEESGLCRTEINRRVNAVKRAFKWAASMELVEGKVWQGLDAVANLRKGHKGTRETVPVDPVADEIVEATCRELHPLMRDLIRFVRLTGCRIGEACSMRAGEIDRAGQVWIYRPGKHKGTHLGKLKSIPIGPRAQAILAPHLEGFGPEEIVFTPAKAMAEIAKAKRDARKTKVQPSQRGTRKGRKPRAYAATYNRTSVLRAIERACDRAGVPRWHPHQLRHTAATEIRSKYGIEAARAVPGHSTVAMPAHYAEIDEAKAAQVIAEID